jgi:hypothetical protein
MGCIHSLLIGTESLKVPPAGCVYVYGVLSRKMGFSQLSMTDLQNSYAVILSVNKFIAIILCRLNCVKLHYYVPCIYWRYKAHWPGDRAKRILEALSMRDHQLENYILGSESQACHL